MFYRHDTNLNPSVLKDLIGLVSPIVSVALCLEANNNQTLIRIENNSLAVTRRFRSDLQTQHIEYMVMLTKLQSYFGELEETGRKAPWDLQETYMISHEILEIERAHTDLIHEGDWVSALQKITPLISNLTERMISFCDLKPSTVISYQV